MTHTHTYTYINSAEIIEEEDEDLHVVLPSASLGACSRINANASAGGAAGRNSLSNHFMGGDVI